MGREDVGFWINISRLHKRYKTLFLVCLHLLQSPNPIAIPPKKSLNMALSQAAWKAEQASLFKIKRKGVSNHNNNNKQKFGSTAKTYKKTALASQRSVGNLKLLQARLQFQAPAALRSCAIFFFLCFCLLFSPLHGPF